MDSTRKPPGFVWEPRYATGLPEVDEQHRVLMGLVNGFLAALGTEREAELVHKGLADFVHYASFHFEAEEALMETYGLGPDQVAEHVTAHGRLIAFVQRKAGEATREPGVARELTQFLAAWLTHHILGCDMRMAAGIRQAREAALLRGPGVAVAV